MNEMADIHPTAIIEDGAKIGQNVKIGPYCHIGAHVSLDDNVELSAHVSVMGHTQIGRATKVSPFASLGHMPVLHRQSDDPGKLEIGERNLIAEHVTICPGQMTDSKLTKIGNDNFFLPQTHVGHDSLIGNHVTFSTGAIIAGHVAVEDYVILSGMVAVHQFCRLGAYSFIGGGSIVVQDVIPFGIVEGNRACLRGLNIVGLQRNGFRKAAIHDIRRAYKYIFDMDEGTFKERVAIVHTRFSDSPDVLRLITFLQAESRGVCLPPKKES